MFRYVALAAAFSSIPFSLAAVSQEYLDTISFGLGDKISPNGRAVPNWHLTGEGHSPQILSDRIILTPPAPGHARGALWTDHGNPETQWSAEASFRASGQDRGTGNFQIWYAKEGRIGVGSNSVYTVPKFDGLVLTVDQHGGRGGMLRGFLNDGSTDYKNHHMVDSLAFGHCNFAYRNQGRYSKVQINHDQRGLEVKIDGQPCFSSEKISLPSGYHFGMTAATSDNPDSFEVNSFSVKTTKTSPHTGHFDSPPPSEHHEKYHLPNAPELIPDRDAYTIKAQQEQFADLHNRIQGLSHQVNNIFLEFDRVGRQLNDIAEHMPKSSDEGLSALNKRMESIERTVHSIERDVAGRDYSGHLQDLHHAVQGVKGGLSVDLPDTLHQVVKGSAPKVTTFIFIVIAVQVMVLGLYIVYKKRRDSAPKKYL